MNTKYIYIYLAVLIVIIPLFNSCIVDEPSFPNTPKITFKSFEYKRYGTGSNRSNDSLLLSIDFQDGDGDLGGGMEEEYTFTYQNGEKVDSALNPNYFNYFVDYYIQKTGVFEKLNIGDPNEVTLNEKFQDLSGDKVGPIEGTLIRRYQALSLIRLAQKQTGGYYPFKLKIHIKDRA